MERTLKRVCTGALLGAAPDGGGIQDMSPYSPNAGSHQPDCEGRY
jgi:hypothetical protein